NYLVYLAGGFVLLLVIAFNIEYRQALWLQEIGQKIILTMRQQVFDHIQTLGPSQLNQVPVGKLVTRVTNDTNTLSEMYTDVAANLIRNVIYLTGILIVLFVINYKITLILMLFLPVVFLATVLFRKYSRASYRKVRSNVSEVNAFLSENLSGMKITQAFNQEPKKRQVFYDKSNQLRKSYMNEILVFGTYRPLMYLFSMIGILLILFLGIGDVINQATYLFVFSAGLLFSYYSYVRDFFEPILQMAEQFNMLQNAFASAEKIFDVLDTEPDIQNNTDAVELESFKGSIVFKDVWFSYIPDEWVLKGVSFEVKPDQTVAFVGATGSGKSTILNLIVRNYDIQKGQILIDGIDIQEIKRESLRKHIGQMLQDVFLFSGTLKDNIKLFDETKTDEAMMEAANYVGLNHVIDNLKDGYDHKVLERGNNFSSGQRQLISFARTVLYRPSLMILDEATANIDSETESIIQESLEKMMNISTMIIVAHRLSTIQHADQIIVMSHGKIVESGSHQELLKEKGLYFNLYQLQYEERKVQ
ncbi:MAG TPA: ABC transporter ATP-binding protein, partial [Acholeplasmataceae bacterium]|nr:ABC transporter ATP-binding protein [Acholeplasmataceae bacterium]